MQTIEKIQKITSKGQITLPVAWRRFTGADTITITTVGDQIKIAPARLQRISEYTVFDAIRDNNGKGIKATDLVKLLRKIDSK